MARNFSWVSLWGLLCLFACDFAANEGHTYLTIKKDPAWSKYDEIEILWKDSAAGTESALFKGPPGNLAAVNRFRADGYRGQRIQIYFRGYIASILAFEEKRGFDGKNPTVVTKEITPIGPVKPARGSRVPVLTPILGGKTISIRDSLTFTSEASIDSGTLAMFAWDCDGDGKFEDSGSIGGSTAQLQSGQRYPDTGTYSVALKVSSGADSTIWATLKVQVLWDAPIADAGKDQNVYPGASVSLQGIGTDGLGTLARTEWRIGTGEFIPGPPEKTFQAPSTPQNLLAIFRVTDDDSIASQDTVIIHVVPTSEPILSGILLSGGSLDTAFQAGDTAYTVHVPNTVEATTITATLSGGKGTLQVNGGTLESGVPSGEIPLVVGENPITLTLASASGAATRYRIKVIRAGNGKELLSGLLLSVGSIAPAFSPTVEEYSLSVASEITFTDVTAAVAAGSTLQINGSLVPSGSPTRVNLSAGPNAIAIVVTSPEATKKTYTVVVLRAADGNADLKSLKVGNFNFSPAFSPSVVAYSLTVDNYLVSIPVTPAAQSPYATVSVNGELYESPREFIRANLKVGANSIPIEVKAQNGTVKTYTLNVTRQLSGVAFLSGLTFSEGQVYPEYFESDSLSLRLFVGNSVASISVTPTLRDTTATIAVNGKPAANKTKSDPVAIPVGASVLAIAVTAQNGTKVTYSVAVMRHAKTAAITCGNTLSIGLREDGTVFTWGYTDPDGVPFPSGLKDVVAIAAGDEHFLAIKTNGTVVAWGKNDKGQAEVPVGLTGVKAVTAGYTHSVALKEDGTVVAWGNDSHHQLKVPLGLSGVKAIDAGGSYTLALLNDSTMVGWGYDVYGESKPPASGFKRVAQISAGGYFNVALKTDGTVIAWGHTLYEQTAVPPGLTGVKAISASMANTLALKVDGSLVAWGDKGGGKDSIPAGITGIKSISMCREHGLALKENGTVVIWGFNNFGQLLVPKDLN